MSRMMKWIGPSAMLVLFAPAQLPAQEIVRPKVAFQAAQESHKQSPQEIDIMGHLANSNEIEFPYWKPPYYYAVHLPRLKPVEVGSVSIDLSPTKHAVFAVIAALLVFNTVRMPAVQAQVSNQYSVSVLIADYTGPNHLQKLQAEINSAANGRQLVALLPFDQPGKYVAVYK